MCLVKTALCSLLEVLTGNGQFVNISNIKHSEYFTDSSLGNVENNDVLGAQVGF